MEPDQLAFFPTSKVDFSYALSGLLLSILRLETFAPLVNSRDFFI